MSDFLDDAAVAALYRLTHEPKEHMGALYLDGDRIAFTPTVSSVSRDNVRGKISVPKGTLRGLYHNHPVIRTRRQMTDVGAGELFSDDDKKQARALNVPSYLITPSGKIMKFDPVTDTVTEVPVPEEVVRTAGAHNTLVK